MQAFLNHKKVDFQPNLKLCIMIIFSVGVIASILIILAALVAVAYLLKLTMTVLVEAGQAMSSLYSHSDSVVQLFMLVLIAYGVYHAGRFALRTMRGK